MRMIFFWALSSQKLKGQRVKRTIAKKMSSASRRVCLIEVKDGSAFWKQSNPLGLLLKWISLLKSRKDRKSKSTGLLNYHTKLLKIKSVFKKLHSQIVLLHRNLQLHSSYYKWSRLFCLRTDVFRIYKANLNQIKTAKLPKQFVPMEKYKGLNEISVYLWKLAKNAHASISLSEI